MNLELIQQFYKDVERGVSREEFMTYCERIQDDILRLPDGDAKGLARSLLYAVVFNGWSELIEKRSQSQRVLPSIQTLIDFVEKLQPPTV